MRGRLTSYVNNRYGRLRFQIGAEAVNHTKQRIIINDKIIMETERWRKK